MTNALPTSTDASLLKHFELQRSPFDRLSDPSELYLTEQHSFLSAHLADAMEESDMLVVVCGQPGSGKTSLLARYCSTAYESICLASIDDRCTDVQQFYASVLGQFGFGEISGTLEQLRHICHEFLMQQGKAGDPVVLLVDNAHKLRPEIFEQLRWVAGIRHELRPIVNLVLAGHPDLAKIMDSPAMSQISAKRHVRFNIRAYTEDETANYIWHRLELAGDRQCVQFSDEAHSLIFRYSGGMPGLINLVCSEAMLEVFKQKKKNISGEIVRRIVERHDLVPHVVPVTNKSRRKTDEGFVDDAMSTQPDMAGQNTADAPEESVSDSAEKTPEKTTKPQAKKAPETGEKPASQPAPDATRPTAGKKRSAASALSIVEKVASLSEQLGDLRARKKDLELELFQRDSAIASLEDRLESEKQSHSEVQNKLTKDEHARDALQKKLNKTRSKLKSQIAKVTALSEETTELKEKLDASLKSGNELQQALVSSEARIEVLEERANLSASLQGALNDREQRVKELEASLRELESASKESRRLEDEQAARIAAMSAQIEEGKIVIDELSELKKVIHDQEHEIQSLRELADADDTDAESADASRLKIRIHDLEQELELANQRYSELEIEKKAEAEEAEKLAKDMAALADEFAAAKQRNDSAKKEALALEEKLAASEKTIRDMQDALRARDEHGDWLKTELDRLQGADESLATATREKAAAEKELRAAQDELHSASEEVSRLSDSLDKAEGAHRELANARQELESLSHRATEAESVAATLTDEKAALENSLSERSSALANLDEQAKDLAQQKESLEGMLEDVTARLAESELTLDSTRQSDENFAAENRRLLDELDSLKEEAKQANALQVQFEKQKELNSKLSATIDKQTEEIAEMTTKLAEQAIAHSKANASLSGMNQLKPEVGELNQQIDELHAQLLSNDENARAIEQQLEANDSQFSEVQGEVAALHDLQSELRDALQTVQGESAELSEAREEILRLRKLATELDESQAESAKAGDEVSELKKQLAESNQKQEAMVQELSESRSHLNDIQKEFAREAEDNHELQRQLLALAEVEEQLREELLQRGDVFEDLSAIENERNQLRDELESLRRIHDSVREKHKSVSRQVEAPEGGFEFELALRHGDSHIDTKKLVGEGEKLLIGRGEQSDVVVDSEFVSRNHLLISVYRGRLFVKDLHSTNGTFVNGKKIAHCEMHDGDKIGIGEHSISLKTAPL
ncbi:MAG: FHA domain-containing protein [Gammaproteobacteria bacterium]|nr:FHA domain-containing protein [Gammaproteobacteria bacterium]